MSEAKGPMAIDAALVEQLAHLLDATHLTEIEVEDGDRRIRVARKAAAVQAAPAYAAPAPAPVVTASAAASSASAPADAAPEGEVVRSPMVGTVYLAPEPGAKPFVAPGDTVAEGDTLMIVEAMKVMNPIAAPRGGRIVRLCVDDRQPVEYDQSLAIID